MATLNQAYNSIADINLWFKIKGGEPLMLSDVPAIIPLRWSYFLNSWEFLKGNIIRISSLSDNPDFVKQQIDDFSKFIAIQRSSSSKINPFQDTITFLKYHAVFENLSIDSISLSNEEIRIIDAETMRVRNFSKNDFLNARLSIIDYRDRMTDTIGLNDADYNKAFSKSSIPKQVNPTIVDMNYLLTLQDSIKTIDFILSNLFAVDTAIDPFALARTNANNPEINIGQYKTGRLVRMNYGEDLQSLADKYLGDSNKWIDIAIANGLKPPYIDEVGQTILLLSNGNRNQINLAELDINGNVNIDKLYINQQIFIKSNAHSSPDQRTIVNIKQIPISGEIVVELDGDNDLSIYQKIDNANIRVFAPNTINSSYYVLIPSAETLPDNRVDDVPWFLAKSAEDEKRAKIDLAIDDNGELIFNTNSDVKLSYGLDNAIQAIKLKMITELGSLRYHPDFGFVNLIGQKNIDVENIKQTIVESITAQIEADSRFERVDSISVEYNTANLITISMTVILAGGNQVIPISFTVNNQ